MALGRGRECCTILNKVVGEDFIEKVLFEQSPKRRLRNKLCGYVGAVCPGMGKGPEARSCPVRSKNVKQLL